MPHVAHRFVICVRTARGTVFHSAFGWVALATHAALFRDPDVAAALPRRLSDGGREAMVVAI